MSSTIAGAPAPIQDEPRRRPFTGRLIVGLAIVTLGVLFLLDNLGLVSAGALWKYWPLIPILGGIAKLLNACSHRERVVGSIFIIVGIVCLAQSLDWIQFNLWRLFWPGIIILLGFSVIARSMGRSRPKNSQTGSDFHAFAFMSGVDRRQSTPDFRGGDATAVMGGCDLDLRQADISNSPAIIDVFAMMGGVDLRVPGNWTVKDEGLAILGGFEDSRKDTAGDPNKVLIVRGVAIMGGVEIKN